ncbi:ABC-2 type transporter [Tannerella forsythia KS16]|uniref:ABC transporter permease n=1 Tax=Tannerella forsythia TaxID=28112 RepID=UPI0006189D0A|nr:ABC transporter permease [Tannerella forsythia]BAR52270.1 ABC-2 type transporter [Tannerella forsythia KS16]
MRQFLSFVKKEWYHIIRDRRTVLILLGIPIMQILLFGFAITTEVKNARLAVFDPSHDEMTQQIKSHFQASERFILTEELASPHEINDVFTRGKADLALIFGERFAENLRHTGEASVQLIIDGAEPNQASMMSGYAQQILYMYRQELAGEHLPSCRITAQVKMLYNPQGKSVFYFVPGIMGMILTLICGMMTSIAIVREKETGTMELLLASPMKPAYIILAKIVPYFVLSVLNLATILIMSVSVLHVPIAGNLILLTAVSLLFIFLALSVGLFISGLVDNQTAAMLASGMGMMMPVMLLSGMIFPVSSMPDALQWLSAAVPARWYIQAVKKIMIQGVGLRFVLKEIAILTAMASVFVALSLKQFKTRLN